MSKLSEDELTKIWTFASQLGREAGEMLMKAVRKRTDNTEPQPIQGILEEKENAVDVVTQTDLDVEAYIKNAITEIYPKHKFIGEETYARGASRAYMIDNDPTWCVDPLDGTVNYIHLFPMFCVSIAFMIGGKPIIGVINAPFLNQFFTACKGKGAWLNGTQRLPLIRNPIPPMPAKAPSGCVFSCEWGKDRRDTPDGNLHRKIESFVNMAAEIGARDGKGGMVHGVRSLGSATLDLAYTAMGSFDM